MASLEAQCVSTVACFMQPLLEDRNWRAFGYKRCPKRGKVFNSFLSSEKLELETVLKRELTGAGFGKIFWWAKSDSQFILRDRFLARLTEIFVDKYGRDVWMAVGYNTREDVLTHLFDAAKEYSSSTGDDHASVFLTRCKRNLQQNLPPVWLVGSAFLFKDPSSMITVIPRALSAAGIATNTVDDLSISSADLITLVQQALK